MVVLSHCGCTVNVAEMKVTLLYFETVTDDVLWGVWVVCGQDQIGRASCRERV